MSRFGTLYLLAPGSDDPARAHERVVETYPNARSYIDIAKELWALADGKLRADALEAVLDRAFEHEAPGLLTAAVLRGQDIDDMLGLLDGLDDALKSTVVDDKMIIRPEQMQRVREHVDADLIDAGEHRGKNAELAIMEALGRVSQLKSLLTEARARELEVAID